MSSKHIKTPPKYKYPSKKVEYFIKNCQTPGTIGPKKGKLTLKRKPEIKPPLCLVPDKYLIMLEDYNHGKLKTQNLTKSQFRFRLKMLRVYWLIPSAREPVDCLLSQNNLDIRNYKRKSYMRRKARKGGRPKQNHYKSSILSSLDISIGSELTHSVKQWKRKNYKKSRLYKTLNKMHINKPNHFSIHQLQNTTKRWWSHVSFNEFKKICKNIISPVTTNIDNYEIMRKITKRQEVTNNLKSS